MKRLLFKKADDVDLKPVYVGRFVCDCKKACHFTKPDTGSQYADKNAIAPRIECKCGKIWGHIKSGRSGKLDFRIERTDLYVVENQLSIFDAKNI